MDNSVARRQAAMENSYFLKLQEEAAERHRARLMKVDPQRLARAAGGVGAGPSSSMLPQIAAHSLRLAPPTESQVIRTVTKYVEKDPLRRPPMNPMFVSNLQLGNKLSVGGAKWIASSTTVQGASIFSAGSALELMEGNKSPLLPPQRSLPKLDMPIVQLGSMRVKLFPDFTPGRALMWGTLLAVWGTSAVAVRTAKAMGISSLEDVRSKFGDALAPIKGSMHATLEPFRDTFAGSHEAVAGSDFSQRLRVSMRS